MSRSNQEGIKDEQTSLSGASTPTSGDSPSSSRSPSPSREPLPEPIASFFGSVSLGGFPKPENKSQPWKKVWKEPQGPTPDGKMVVACPKKCVYGSSNLGGY